MQTQFFRLGCQQRMHYLKAMWKDWTARRQTVGIIMHQMKTHYTLSTIYIGIASSSYFSFQLFWFLIVSPLSYGDHLQTWTCQSSKLRHTN